MALSGVLTNNRIGKTKMDGCENDETDENENIYFWNNLGHSG